MEPLRLLILWNDPATFILFCVATPSEQYPSKAGAHRIARLEKITAENNISMEKLLYIIRYRYISIAEMPMLNVAKACVQGSNPSVSPDHWRYENTAAKTRQIADISCRA